MNRLLLIFSVAVTLGLSSGCSRTCGMICSDYVNPVSCPKPIEIKRPILSPPKQNAPADESQRAIMIMLNAMVGYAEQCEKALDAYR